MTHTSDRDADRVSFRILGPLTITNGADEVVLQPSKPTSLLATLLLHPNEVVSTQMLQRAIWGDQRPIAKAVLHTCLLRLRQLFIRHGIAGTTIETVSVGYRITVGGGSLDLVRFRALTREAQAATDPETELSILEEALALWHGQMLTNVQSDLLQRDVVPRITEERVRALERVSDLKIGLGRARSALVGLWEAVRNFPTHERFAEQLAESLYRVGRKAEALAELRRVKQHLNDELGVDPGARLHQLEVSILRGEPLNGDHAAATGSDQWKVSNPGLVGRDRARRELAERVSAESALVVLTGPPGVGKTALARQVANACGPSFPGGHRLVCMRDQAGQPIPDEEVAAQLGVGEHAPASSDHSRRLFVLDDACNADQVLRAAGHFGSPGGSLLVTSRNSLSGLVARYGGWLYRVPVLTPEDAVRMLTDMLGTDRWEGEQEALHELAALCGYLPLALRIISTRLQIRPAMPLAEAVAWLREDRLARLALPGDPEMSLVGRLDDALAQLGPALQEGLVRLGAGAPTGITIDTYAELLDQDPDKAESLLEELVDAGWVERGPQHYWMHDLLHTYARCARGRLRDESDLLLEGRGTPL